MVLKLVLFGTALFRARLWLAPHALGTQSPSNSIFYLIKFFLSRIYLQNDDFCDFR